jgi:hypothetical protein
MFYFGETPWGRLGTRLSHPATAAEAMEQARLDFTFINYSFPVSSVKARVRIFDSIGRLIATPVDNVILPSSGKVVWDGRDGSGKIVRFGLHILLVEMNGPDGKSISIYKQPLVVAKKMK